MSKKNIKTRLKICIVSREYPPETLWGGIGTFTYNLAHGLSNIGHSVDVIAFTLGADSYVEDNGIKIHRLSSPKIPYRKETFWDIVPYALSPFAFFYSRKVNKKIEDLHRESKFDVIDFPEHIGEGFFSIRKKKHPSLVRLYTPLSLIGQLGLNKTTNKFDYWLFGLMERSSIKRATIINSPSRALADLVKNKFNVRRDIELIYNPIDTDIFKPNGSEENSHSDTIKVLFVGGLTDRKGVHILTRAIPEVVKKVKNIKFSILGGDSAGVEGYKSMKEYMIKVFSDNKVKDEVEFVERVPYEKLPEIYNKADISVVPSLFDNSPYTCLEAMSCGLPVIGTSAGGMPEYIDDGKNGIIIPPANIGLLVNALNELSLNCKKRKLYSQNARDKAVKKFKREIIAEEITKLYIRAIDLSKIRSEKYAQN